MKTCARKEQETRRQQAFAQGDETERVMKIYREAIKYQRGCCLFDYIWWMVVEKVRVGLVGGRGPSGILPRVLF